jgi:hypothetical protein
VTFNAAPKPQEVGEELDLFKAHSRKAWERIKDGSENWDSVCDVTSAILNINQDMSMHAVICIVQDDRQVSEID